MLRLNPVCRLLCCTANVGADCQSYVAGHRGLLQSESQSQTTLIPRITDYCCCTQHDTTQHRKRRTAHSTQRAEPARSRAPEPNQQATSQQPEGSCSKIVDRDKIRYSSTALPHNADITELTHIAQSDEAHRTTRPA